MPTTFDNEQHDWQEDEVHEDYHDFAEDDEVEEAPCPSCGQLIAEDSPKCPHCGDWVIRRGQAHARSRNLTYLVFIAVLVAGLVWITSC